MDIQVGQAGLGFERDVFGGQDPLVRSSGCIIAFDELFVHVFFRDQFEDWLEEVGI